MTAAAASGAATIARLALWGLASLLGAVAGDASATNTMRAALADTAGDARAHTAPASGKAAAESAAHAVLERVIGVDAAAQIVMTLSAPEAQSAPAAPETFTISGTPGRIAIFATTSSALTEGAGWYLKYVARADLMLSGTQPALPAILPAPPEAIRRSATMPHRYALNDTNDAYTDPFLSWADWENQLDLMALHGINEVYLTVGTDAVYHVLMQRYGYSSEEVRRWIPDPAHQPWWILQNMSGDGSSGATGSPISEALLARRARLGRQIADRARELGITPVFPGYWGTVPTDFAARNPGADVIAQDLWVGYQRPGWLNPSTELFTRVAADYYAISEQVLGASTMYKMDPLHEGGTAGHADLGQAAAAIERALQRAHGGATWAILGWLGNPSNALLDGIADKSRVLLLAAEADRDPTWDSAQRWSGVPYALGSIYNFGGHDIIGANATTIVDRWFADLEGPNKANLRGVAIVPESWTRNPVVAELMSELPWHSLPFSLDDWLRDYAAGRYGSADAHATKAWSIFGATAYATAPDSTSEAQDSLFNAQPGLTVTAAGCCRVPMRYSGPDFEQGWRELLAAAPSVTQAAPFRFDLTDTTRQVIANRARVLLPLVRRAYETGDRAQLAALTGRWLQLMDLSDRVTGTNAAFLLGPRLDHARANAATPDEARALERNAVNLITNWGTREGYEAGLRDYANRDWNCLTRGYYKLRWARFFDGLAAVLAGGSADPVDWYRIGDEYAGADHSDCASVPAGDIVALAYEVRAVLDAGPEASSIAAGWASYTENDALFGSDEAGYAISSAGADIWSNVNRYGVLYQRRFLRDGGSATVHVAGLRSEAGRPWARAGLMAGTGLESTHPRGFANVALTPAHGCVFSWAKDPDAGLADYTSMAVPGASWLRLGRIGDTYIGSCSADGVTWSIVGSARPGGPADAADVGMFASAANAGGSDRLDARFDRWQGVEGEAAGDVRIAIEYLHAGFGHYFTTALPDEIAMLDAGLFPGWARTGEGFAVHTGAGADRVPVCRFFTTAFPPTSSHFYAPRGFGCESALALAEWQFEGEVFYAALPQAGGECPADSTPLYRLYNDGQGGAPNHRFTTSPQVRARMLARGFIAEGAGVGVGMCVPR